MAKADKENKLGIIVHPASTRVNKKSKKKIVESLIQLDALPVLWARLAEPKVLDVENDKYAVMLALSADQRTQLLKDLGGAAKEVIKELGLSFSEKDIQMVLRNKMKEAEEEGQFRITVDQKMAFDHTAKGGDIVGVDIPVKDKDGNPIENPQCAEGSFARVNFDLTASANVETGKLNLPFRLRAVQFTEFVPYEGADGPNKADFSAFDGDY